MSHFFIEMCENEREKSGIATHRFFDEWSGFLFLCVLIYIDQRYIVSILDLLFVICCLLYYLYSFIINHQYHSMRCCINSVT